MRENSEEFIASIVTAAWKVREIPGISENIRYFTRQRYFYVSWLGVVISNTYFYIDYCFFSVHFSYFFSCTKEKNMFSFLFVPCHSCTLYHHTTSRKCLQYWFLHNSESFWFSLSLFKVFYRNNFGSPWIKIYF